MDEHISKILEDFENRKKHSGFDVEILKSISDDELTQAIFDYLSENIIKGDYKNEYDKIKKMSRGFQYIYAVWLLEGEINNGGFNQYFYNSSGLFAEEAYTGCINIGAKKTAEIVKKAIDILLKEKELHKNTKKLGTLEAFSESYNETKLGICDNEFFQTGEDLTYLMVKYIRNNYILFVTDKTNT